MSRPAVSRRGAPRRSWWIIRLVLLGALAPHHPARALTIAQNGEPRAAIVIHEQASASERHAAAELAAFLTRVTGATFPIGTAADQGRARLLVGPGAARLADADFTTDGLGVDGIVLRTVGDDLILAGDPPRGTLYAVYTFLEDHVGCHWWSPTARTIPHRPTLRVGDLDVRHVPPFEYREVSYHHAVDGDYAVRNRLNGQCHRLFVDDGFHNARPDARRGGRRYAWHKSDKWRGHTFYTLIPPEVYFRDHPEWFAEIRDDQVYGTGYDGFPNAGGTGRRPASVEQCKQQIRSLCLTDEAMRRELVRNAKLAINWSPIATAFSVSQVDGMNPCRCDRCMTVVNAEGAYAGLMIRFVNAVAKDLARFTAMPIDTYAYHYTRRPPLHVRPSANVIVWLVVAYDEIAQGPDTREISFSRPLTDARNRTFAEDLAGWARICDRLFIYDYAVNFTHPLLPHPNLRVLGPNIRLYAEHGVKGILYEAHGRSPGTELAELRAWLLARLFWDPDQDVDALIARFARGYYGPAGEHVLACIDVMHGAVDASGDWLGPGSGYQAAFLSLDTLCRAWSHLAAAEAAVAAHPELRFRVRVAQLPVLYTFLMRWNELRGAARAAASPWPLPESPADVFDGFLDVARRKGITAMDDTGAADYIRGMLARRAAP